MLSPELALTFSVAIGLLLDYIFGDPRQMPHLVKAIGKLSLILEERITQSIGRTLFSGTLHWLAIVAIILASYAILSALISPLGQFPKIVLDALLVFQAVAFTDLVKHVRDIRSALNRSLAHARYRVSMIVGRDTDQMEQDDICRATLESASENLSDSVVAPLFWFALLGPIGLLIYRTTNTLDAMVGHRTERYEQFGKATARIDDALNFVPARLCALAILHHEHLKEYPTLAPDARLHPSVNAGWPEAAMSRRLGVVFGGKMYEKGQLVQTAMMNARARQPTPNDIDRCITIMNTAYLKGIALLAIVLLMRIIF